MAYNVLFLCTGNSARSIMAEAILNRIGDGEYRAFSAGSFPKGRVHPAALELLAGLGYGTDDFRSKSWSEFVRPEAPRLDFVFTVCDRAAGEVHPIWPSRPTRASWTIPDPAAVTGNETAVMRAFRHAYAMLERRIELFVALPGRLALQQQMEEMAETSAGR
jgi:protein-tyrosine-phosphatase